MYESATNDGAPHVWMGGPAWRSRIWTCTWCPSSQHIIAGEILPPFRWYRRIFHCSQQALPTILSHFLLPCLSVLDPVLKLEYLNTMWEPKYIAIRMKRFKAQVSRSFIGSFCLQELISFQFLVYKARYEGTRKKTILSSTACYALRQLTHNTCCWDKCSFVVSRDPKGTTAYTRQVVSSFVRRFKKELRLAQL